MYTIKKTLKSEKILASDNCSHPKSLQMKMILRHSLLMHRQLQIFKHNYCRELFPLSLHICIVFSLHPIRYKTLIEKYNTTYNFIVIIRAQMTTKAETIEIILNYIWRDVTFFLKHANMISLMTYCMSTSGAR